MIISFKLNDNEFNLIKSYAKRRKQTVSKVIRNAIMKRVETEHDLMLYENAMRKFKLNPITYSQEDIERYLNQ